jgi:hypothetical protein
VKKSGENYGLLPTSENTPEIVSNLKHDGGCGKWKPSKVIRKIFVPPALKHF